MTLHRPLLAAVVLTGLAGSTSALRRRRCCLAAVEAAMTDAFVLVARESDTLRSRTVEFCHP
jgi:hypothetical protein